MQDVEEVIKRRKPDFVIMPSFEVLHSQENCFKIMTKEVEFKGQGNGSVKVPSTRRSQDRGQDLWNPGGHWSACLYTQWAPGSVRTLSQKLRWEVREETSGLDLCTGVPTSTPN